MNIPEIRELFDKNGITYEVIPEGLLLTDSAYSQVWDIIPEEICEEIIFSTEYGYYGVAVIGADDYVVTDVQAKQERRIYDADELFKLYQQSSPG